MKKTRDFCELSDKRCAKPGCTKRLKLRLVEQKEPQNIRFCFAHYREARRRQQSHRTVVRYG